MSFFNGEEPDERVAEAIAVVAKGQPQNGRWPLNNFHPDRVHFDMEDGVGKASRWNTLRSLRVLDWYSMPVYKEKALEAHERAVNNKIGAQQPAVPCNTNSITTHPKTKIPKLRVHKMKPRGQGPQGLSG